MKKNVMVMLVAAAVGAPAIPTEAFASTEESFASTEGSGQSMRMTTDEASPFGILPEASDFLAAEGIQPPEGANAIALKRAKGPSSTDGNHGHAHNGSSSTLNAHHGHGSNGNQHDHFGGGPKSKATPKGSRGAKFKTKVQGAKDKVKKFFGGK
jgi:hypothetical protein